jgi:carboxyl-terminal processing protease
MMRGSRRMVLALGCGALAGALLPLAHSALGGPSDPLPLAELRSFSQTLDAVRSSYVDPVGPDKLIEYALRGMVDGLEPHSHYLDKDEFKEWSINTSGKYGGVGLEVEVRDGFVRVVSAMDNTPAAVAGIQPGDIISTIDGESTSGLKLKDAVDRMRGDKGTRLRLGILREGSPRPLMLTLVRDAITVASVRGLMLEPGIGYLRVTQFSSDTGDAVQAELDKLQKQASGTGLRGLILDLRNNPGGIVSAAVQASDAFLEEGVIVTQRGRAPGATHEYDAGPGDLLKGRPLVAVVNGGTASAAEIMAGALQDHHRAVLVGETTFGKGLVQSVTPLQTGGALVLTIARYYTPNGRSIQAEGIRPDIEIAPIEVSAAGEPPPRTAEADLHGALPNEHPRAAAPAGPGTGLKPGDTAKLATGDYVLYNSLTVLKGMIASRNSRTG